MAIKVGNLSDANRGINAVGTPEPRPVRNDKQVTFQRMLSNMSEHKHREHMQELFGQISEQGKKLTERADINELEKYRAMIRDFMEEVASNGYEFSKETTYGARGRRKIIATIKTVNEELDALAKDFLAGESENLKILERVGLIHGLLVDMLM